MGSLSGIPRCDFSFSLLSTPNHLTITRCKYLQSRLPAQHNCITSQRIQDLILRNSLSSCLSWTSSPFICTRSNSITFKPSFFSRRAARKHVNTCFSAKSGGCFVHVNRFRCHQFDEQARSDKQHSKNSEHEGTDQACHSSFSATLEMIALEI
jgi:hypothetical protein